MVTGGRFSGATRGLMIEHDGFKKTEWTQSELKHKSGLLAQYAMLVSSASEGAVLNLQKIH